jgi:sec-independent protein translocase protein TatB
MDLGIPEMIFIGVLALIIFGPKKLPEIGRQIGRALNEFKKASNEFKAQIESEISSMELAEMQRKILATTDAPEGTVASGELITETQPATSTAPSSTPELNHIAKAPDA